MGCPEGGKWADETVAAVVSVAAAAGIVDLGPIHAGIVGKADMVEAAPLACCWYPRQHPEEERENKGVRSQ